MSQRWYRGNLHMHSFWSDGCDFPECVAAWFKEAGYHFIAFTEHDQHQVGERWLRCDPETVGGRTVAANDLVGKYVRAAVRIGSSGGGWTAWRKCGSMRWPSIGISLGSQAASSV